MATRLEVRSYYRKIIGFLSAINAFWVMCISGLAIYISDFGELSPDTNAQISEFVLYGFYMTFFLGAFAILCLLIGGIVGMVSSSEGIFKFLMIISVMTSVFTVVFIYSTIYSLWFAKITWSASYAKTILYIGLALGLVVLAYSVTTIVMSILGRKYYDIGKKAPKDVSGEVKVARLNNKFTGITMASFIVMSLAIYLLCLYFKNDVKAYDALQYVDNSKYIGLFSRVFYAGIVMSVIQLVMTVLIFVKGSKTIMYANKIVLLGQCAVIAFYIIVSATAMGQEFSKRGYADSSYIIFSYLMVIINFIVAVRAFRQKLSE